MRKLIYLIIINGIFCLNMIYADTFSEIKINNEDYAIIRVNYKFVSGTVRRTETMIRNYSRKVILINDLKLVKDLLVLLNTSEVVDSRLIPNDLFAVIDISIKGDKYTFLFDRWNFQLKGSKIIYKNPEKFLENYI